MDEGTIFLLGLMLGAGMVLCCWAWVNTHKPKAKVITLRAVSEDEASLRTTGWCDLCRKTHSWKGTGVNCGQANG